MLVMASSSSETAVRMDDLSLEASAIVSCESRVARSGDSKASSTAC